MKLTQSERILQYIDVCGSITPIEAFRDLGVTKLATRISEMKKQGLEIDSELVYSTNRFGEPVHYMKYSNYRWR